MALSTDEFKFIADMIFKQSAMVLDEKKKYLVESRIKRVMDQEFLWTAAELITKLKEPASTQLRTRIVDAMTVNETSFFRDGIPFDELRQDILPAAIKSRANDKQLDIWCAASSTGQEPYSVAMTIRQHFPQLGTWRVKITASDISDRVLEQARAGRYSQLEVNRGLNPTTLSKFFTRDNDHWVANKDLRDLIEYKKLNLSEPFVGLPKFDIVYIRNVLIYFNMDTKKDIIAKIAKVMRPDGIIVLGAAETMLGLSDGFERRNGCRAAAYNLKTR